MATAKKTPAKKTGKGSAARKPKKTPGGLTPVLDDNSFVAPKLKPKTEKVVTLAEALAEAGQTMDDLIPPPEERPARTTGSSNLAITIRNHRNQYAVALAPNGKKTQNCGDAVAAALLRIPLAAMAEYVASKLPGARYDHLNPGHQRMCLGNRIRAWAKQNDQNTLIWLETAQIPEGGINEQPADEADLDNDEQARRNDTSAE